MPDFAGHVGPAPVKLMIDHSGGTDAGAHGQHNTGFIIFSKAKHIFRDAMGFDLIVNNDIIDSRQRPQDLRYGDIVPLHLGRETDRIILDQPGAGHTDRPDDRQILIFRKDLHHHLRNASEDMFRGTAAEISFFLQLF